MNCILCGSLTEKFKVWRENQYYRCKGCGSIVLDPMAYVSGKEEKTRYEEHNNDVEDKRYQKFVSPIVSEVLKDYSKNHKGLDFGSGTGPVITKLLRDQDYNIKKYDPFFANSPQVLEEKYDYIACCEVIEHFHDPKKEFKLLRSLLKAGGSLYIMTSIYSEDIEFDSWNYKDDPTHVFFYHKNALEWIEKEFGFSHLEIKKDLIIYKV